MSKRHKVRVQSWINGLLTTAEHFFDTAEEAIAHSIRATSMHASGSDAHVVKVYDHSGELVHEVNSLPPQTTYA